MSLAEEKSMDVKCCQHVLDPDQGGRQQGPTASTPHRWQLIKSNCSSSSQGGILHLSKCARRPQSDVWLLRSFFFIFWTFLGSWSFFPTRPLFFSFFFNPKLSLSVILSFSHSLDKPFQWFIDSRTHAHTVLFFSLSLSHMYTKLISMTHRLNHSSTHNQAHTHRFTHTHKGQETDVPYLSQPDAYGNDLILLILKQKKQTTVSHQRQDTMAHWLISCLSIGRQAWPFEM